MYLAQVLVSACQSGNEGNDDSLMHDFITIYVIKALKECYFIKTFYYYWYLFVLYLFSYPIESYFVVTERVKILLASENEKQMLFTSSTTNIGELLQFFFIVSLLEHKLVILADIEKWKSIDWLFRVKCDNFMGSDLVIRPDVSTRLYQRIVWTKFPIYK